METINGKRFLGGGNPMAFDGSFALYERDILMYRNPSRGINWAAEIKEWTKGFALMAILLVAFLGWTIALNVPTCTHDYKTNITSC